MVIDRFEKITLASIPKEGLVFKGYKKHIIQDLEIKPVNTCYHLEIWRDSDGKYHYGQLPDYLQRTDFGPKLKQYILYQYHHAHVTQPLLLEQLHELGIRISSGQLSNLLTHNHDRFHREKEDLLVKALQCSGYLQTDDTGTRHQGNNGYCTFIGNDVFSYFTSTSSKSRINFLQALSVHPSYVFNGFAMEYMTSQGLGPKHFNVVDQMEERFADQAALQLKLEKLKVSKHAIKIMTEAALLGGLTEKGLSEKQVILSDDAGQFKVLKHALCWVHIERNLQKIHTYTTQQRNQLDQVLQAFWELYQLMKTYQGNPSQKLKQECLESFQSICDWQTDWIALKKGLSKLKTYKDEMLVVLEHPQVPLHNNQSERDIREFVKKRKISGSTRSEQGRKARDTFASLKKTSRKLNISFWDFLFDRITDAKHIEYLPEIMKRKGNPTS